MCDIAEILTSYYDGVDRDILIAGIILHDIGKTIELSGPIATKYTLEGKLIGHISIMVSEIRNSNFIATHDFISPWRKRIWVTSSSTN